MVGTILPIVYGERRANRRVMAAWLHLAGAIVGGATAGALLGALGTLVPGPTRATGPAAAALLAVAGTVHWLYAIRQVGLWRFPMPQSTWQVPRAWVHVLPPRVTAFLYGLLLGPSVFTRIPVSTFYIVMFWAVVCGSPWWGAAILGACGGGRVLPILALARLANDGNEMARWTVVLGRWYPVVELVNVLVLTASGMWLFGSGVLWALLG